MFVEKISSNREDIFWAIEDKVESGWYIVVLGFYFKFATSGSEDRLEGFRKKLFLEKISPNTEAKFGGNIFPVGNNFPSQIWDYFPLEIPVKNSWGLKDFFSNHKIFNALSDIVLSTKWKMPTLGPDDIIEKTF